MPEHRLRHVYLRVARPIMWDADEEKSKAAGQGARTEAGRWDEAVRCEAGGGVGCCTFSAAGWLAVAIGGREEVMGRRRASSLGVEDHEDPRHLRPRKPWKSCGLLNTTTRICGSFDQIAIREDASSEKNDYCCSLRELFRGTLFIS